MKVLNSPQCAADWCNAQRSMGLKIGFVPTMGALHDGHLSLVKRAVEENEACCASIFVNPLQFNNSSDLASYPVTFDQDLLDFEINGCDMVFTGNLAQFFPNARDSDEIKLLDPGPAAEGLEGTFRPGHLEGVVTIVDRLFNTVGSCTAYFGEKDFQQTMVVRDLAARLLNEGLRVEIATCATVREPNGLAMSSRNRLLSASQVDQATNIYAALERARTSWRNGNHVPRSLEQDILDDLNQHGLSVEYAAVRDQDNWSPETPEEIVSAARALVAAYVGEVRLIDNLFLGCTRDGVSEEIH